MSKILIELVSYRDDGKFIENETNEEMSLEEAINCVIDYWDDMGATYYSWICKKVDNQDDKIKELQERNDRQRERLDNLYQLILNRDYDGQEELIKELEGYEQALQEEMKLYCR